MNSLFFLDDFKAEFYWLQFLILFLSIFCHLDYVTKI